MVVSFETVENAVSCDALNSSNEVCNLATSLRTSSSLSLFCVLSCEILSTFFARLFMNSGSSERFMTVCGLLAPCLVTLLPVGVEVIDGCLFTVVEFGFILSDIEAEVGWWMMSREQLVNY